tara:strand:+ start:3250 stop:3756 length:507 start_codon:yes stop_codon:yes gene_type:complete
MIFKNSINFKIKSRLFKIKNIKLSDISNNYINSLNSSKYLRYKRKYSILSQKKYIKKIKESSNNCIVGIYFKEELIGTMNSQVHKFIKIGNKRLKNAISFGILIFNNYQNKKIGANSIKYYSKFLSKSYENIFSTIHKNNKNSIKVFVNSGFKKINFKTNNTQFFFYR